MNYGRVRGFSLVELLLSVALLSLGILALLSLLTASQQASSKSEELTAAGAVAEAELQRAVRAAARDIPTGELARFWAADFPPGGVPFVQGDTRVGRTSLHYEVFATTVLNSSSTENRLKQIEVRVSWWGGEREGYGQLNTVAAGLVSEP